MYSMFCSFKFNWQFYILKNSLKFYSTTDLHHSLILISNLLSHFTVFLTLTILKWRGHGVYHTPPSSVELKNKWRYNSAPSTRIHGIYILKFTSCFPVSN